MKSYTATHKALMHKDYGAVYTPAQTSFRVWAPKAEHLKLALYDEWNDFYRSEYDLYPQGDGTWLLTLEGDYKGKYYTYLLKTPEEDRIFELIDPWGRASAPNSLKSLVVDLRETDPPGFRTHKRPDPLEPLESVLYELHIRDYTVHATSGVSLEHKGKYLGLTDAGATVGPVTTGLGHLKELGITHVHLMPVSDFKTVDEMQPTAYNWGYDPVQFNVPEGSYATDPTGTARITELKAMIQALHEAGIRVVLDVVYNHTFYNEESNLNRLGPNYFYRMRGQALSDGSGCGNELAIGKPMVDKFVLESLQFWLEEYQVDGFRFDLMGLYDQESMKHFAEVLQKKRPDLLLYGEPWVGGHTGLMHKKQFLKGCQRSTGIAVFDDEFRDAVKGDNDGFGKGIIQGNGHTLFSIRKGIAGEIAYNKHYVGFADHPAEIIHYICAHDNLILRDKIEKVMESGDVKYLQRINRLAFAIQLTAFGIPFIHEGTEFYRTKHHDHNSYCSSDFINAVDWQLKADHEDFYLYIQQLIAFRRRIGLFNKSAEEVKKSLKFQDVEGLSYTIDHEGYRYHIFHNFYDVPLKRQVPKGALVYFWNDTCSGQGIEMDTRKMLEVESKSTLIYRVLCEKGECQ